MIVWWLTLGLSLNEISCLCPRGSESVSRSHWQYCMSFFCCIFFSFFLFFFLSFSFFFFGLVFFIISLERRKTSFLYILIPLIIPTSYTPRLRRPLLIRITKRGGCKVYRSAKNQALSLFQTRRLWVNLTHTSSCVLTTPPPQLLEIKGGSQRVQLSFYQEYLPMASFSLSSPLRWFLS